jgi:hypothetical protein
VKGTSVQSPANVVYSTAPFAALDESGALYFVKGEDDCYIVLAEIIAHMFAGIVQIPVPGYAVGRFIGENNAVFASAVIENVTRDVTPWIKTRKVRNFDMLAKLIVLDTWLANNDRNIGNLLGRDAGSDGEIEFVAIDFEKAAVVRKSAPLIEIPMMPPKSFWPRGLLGEMCRNVIKLNVQTLDIFKKISDEKIAQVVVTSSAAVRCGEERNDSIINVLKKRRDNLSKLVNDVWN